MNKQSRSMSLVESIANVVVGFGVAVGRGVAVGFGTGVGRGFA